MSEQINPQNMANDMKQIFAKYGISAPTSCDTLIPAIADGVLNYIERQCKDRVMEIVGKSRELSEKVADAILYMTGAFDPLNETMMKISTGVTTQRKWCLAGHLAGPHDRLADAVERVCGGYFAAPMLMAAARKADAR